MLGAMMTITLFVATACGASSTSAPRSPSGPQQWRKGSGDPAQLDRDADRVADHDDLCAADPEDRDGWEDEDGCPESNNDGDPLLDAQDQCPNEPETVNGREDEDGCPD
jgi:OmpA-OmpF porin, OOP family